MSAYGNVACVQTQLSWKCGSKVIIFIVSRFSHQILRAILRSFFDLCGVSAFSIYKNRVFFPCTPLPAYCNSNQLSNFKSYSHISDNL